MTTYAIIDGDVAAYMACPPLLESRGGTYQVTLDAVSAPTFTMDEDSDYLGEAWDKFNFIINDLVEITFADDFLMAVKVDEGFRRFIYPDYKIKRHSNPRHVNKFVPMLRKKAVMEGMAVEATFREADDLLCMWAEQARRNGDDYIVCSIDKDLKCIPGLHYNMKHNNFFEISEEDSLRFYYEQLLKGDSTDGVPGLPGVGDVYSKQYLSECHTEEEFRAKVIEAYKTVWEEDWRDYLLSNGKMLYLQRHPEDYFEVTGWLQESPSTQV